MSDENAENQGINWIINYIESSWNALANEPKFHNQVYIKLFAPLAQPRKLELRRQKSPNFSMIKNTSFYGNFLLDNI